MPIITEEDALCVIFMILVSLENVKKYSYVVARLPQRLKSMLFEIFSTLRVLFGHPPFEQISNNIDFSLLVGKNSIVSLNFSDFIQILANCV